MSAGARGNSAAVPEISVVVPAYDEGALLEANLAEIHSTLSAAGPSFEIVVVDDGSADTTRAIADRAAAAHSEISVVAHSENRGLGAALRSGFMAATGEIVVALDADLTYDPGHVIMLVDALEGTAARIAVASPYARGGRVSGVPSHRIALSRVANRLLARRYGLATTTGMVRAYRREFLRDALADVGDDDLLFGLLRAAARPDDVVEVAAHLDWTRVPGRVSKRRTRDSIRAVVRALRTPRRSGRA